MQTCLVSGGAGFIGSHLIDELLRLDYRVICIDNLATGNYENIQEAKNNSRFTFIKLDVTSPLPIIGQIDYIFHLASPASVIDYQNLPLETALVNSLGTKLLLELAKTYKSKFLFTSTSEIYGNPKEHPQKESYWGNVNPIGIRSCYDESKRFGEMLTMLFVQKYHVDARIVRIFNTYGPRLRRTDGRVISNFINQAINNKPISIYGTGKQTRSFCYVSDMVDGLISAITKNKTVGEVFNLGNPEEYKIFELAGIIKKLLDSKSEILYKKLPCDDPELRRPDITKANNYLNWSPKVSLVEGLKKTIEYYRKSK
jgi:nucleoside-diphosphate-sugar epimerase